MAKVPIMDEGSYRVSERATFGEKGIAVSTEMTRK